MNLRLLTYALLACSMTTVSACEQEPEIKIAKIEILRARAKRTVEDTHTLSMLEYLNFFETFAGKNLTTTEISEKIDTIIFSNLWANTESEMKQYMGNEKFAKERNTHKKNFDEQVSPTKPLLIELLTKNDADETGQLPTLVEVNKETENQEQL